MGNMMNRPLEPIHPNEVQAMHTFLGLLAHEIHSQIAGIWTTSGALLKERKMDADMQTVHFSQIHAASYNVMQVLDNMVDTAKFDHGNLALHPVHTRFLFREWLQPVIRPLEVIARSKDIKINVNVSDGVPEYFVTDAVKLGQVLGNLVNNAVKAAPLNTDVELYVYPMGNSHVCFEVTDQGKGIAEDKIHLLFQPFRQLEKGRVGMGLGLYISKLCVMALGGEIMAYSQSRGTTFKFFITLQRDTPSIV
ncbi:sensor histidine kinase [Chitinophaga japonensis]|uniref:histidine kinase n=1 Tax=Chitinophaga japonensis TaxID=104662 RepID=A0A562SU82_CHIJA|nr:HAMP domain-containing sensor histidine kinase [Chitinophaga japonensis]TWI84276.1 histidine kinase/DNA gyrase B/HSP90-like ATPase [Chitinophaga japonensis]